MSRTLTCCVACVVAVSCFGLTPRALAQQTVSQQDPAIAPPAGSVIDQYIPPIGTLTLNRTLARPALPVPEGDFATAATNEPIPACYITPPWYSVRRPNRTLYPFQHRPLYFEDVAAERCGDSCGCLQPGVSFVKFSADFLLLPCRMCQDCPNECIPAGLDCPVDLPVRRTQKPRSSGRKPASASATATATPTPEPEAKTAPVVAVVRPVSFEKSTAVDQRSLSDGSSGLQEPEARASGGIEESRESEGILLPAVTDLPEPPEFARHPGRRSIKRAK
jgi:hypothetical protein